MEQAVNIWRWTTASPPQAWGKLARDPELWDPEGDALVYFGYRYHQAAFRIPSSVLRNTGSNVFLNLLRESRRFHDGDSSSVETNRPTGPSPTGVQGRGSSSDGSSSIFSSRQELDVLRATANGKANKSNPSLSFTTGTKDSDDDPSIQYDIYFPAPPKLSRAAAIRFHLTTRNVLALLMNKALVGLDFCSALKDLQRRLELYMPPKTNCAKLIVRYLVLKQLHNVSNNPSTAAGLLAWSEEPTVLWHEGWREAFVHCCGMYPRLSQCPEWENISRTTREMLDNAHSELQARIRSAEDRLLTFKFDDIWPVQKAQQHPAKIGFDSFRLFLRQHFEKSYKSWRNRVKQEHRADSWLTRELVNSLQEDHGALYDFLVDRDMVWGTSGKVMRRNRAPSSGLDVDDTPVANLLTTFDHRHDYTPILHPYPLLPSSVPIEESPEEASSHRLSLSTFGSRASRARDKRVAQAYSEANNSRVIDRRTRANALVEAFRRYEKADAIRQMDPRDARKGRWMLLYCTLQVLAGISVDTPHLFFKDVPYFLNPRLTNAPPWAAAQRRPTGAKTVVGVYDEASRLYSHCWVVPKTWTATPGGGLTEHNQIVVTAGSVEDYSIQAEATTFEIKGETFRLHGSGSSDDEDENEEGRRADLERVGMPGFRAPLRMRSQTFKETTGAGKPRDGPAPAMRSQSVSKKLVGGDVGRSDYAPPNEW